MTPQPPPTVALLPWGNLWEDFLDPLGISLETFCEQGPGGWMLGYVDALRSAGVRTIVFLISSQVTTPIQRVHLPSGCTFCILPASNSYLALHRRMANPYGSNVRETFKSLEGLNYWIAPSLRDIAPYLATPLNALAHQLRQNNCQVILCQEYEYPRFDLSVLLGQWLRLPVYATFQGGDQQLTRLERVVRPVSMQVCSGLIIPTQTEIQRVQARYRLPADKIAQIFNPLDLQLWQGGDGSHTRNQLGIPAVARVVVWHGRVDLHRKGLDVLMHAWKQVCVRHPDRDLRLLLIGTGQDADRLSQMIREMELQGIHWVNEYILDRQRIRDYLTAADLYVLSSRHEGFAVAPLEAMACGLPIAATDAPGVPDILDQGEQSGGLMVPKENAAALAEAMERLLTHDLWRQEMGQRARHRVETSFSLEAVGQQLHRFLRLDASLPQV